MIRCTADFLADLPTVAAIIINSILSYGKNIYQDLSVFCDCIVTYFLNYQPRSAKSNKNGIYQENFELVCNVLGSHVNNNTSLLLFYNIRKSMS